jgi:dTDP-4-amino-4,6-dideoxygalactose transaminase
VTYGYAARDIATGLWRAGDDCRLLEKEVADIQNIGHAITVPMARVGIYLAVSALVRPGRKIVLAPYTLADVINMVICAGAIPVFADIERSSCNISSVRVSQLIDDHTDAVLVTHLHGLACDMPRLVEVCQQRGVKLIEDAAQAFGTRLNGQAVGTFGV